MFGYYILLTASALIFFYGFFPLATTNTNFENEPPSYINNISLKREEIYASNITKTVIIVIDALRLDFVKPNLMPLTWSILKKKGCLNKIKVETPTVTLPRIKALTAGNIPQFTDIVLNLASTEMLSDSLVHSAHKQGKKVVFYGDNTWLKLFPTSFTRFEGTNSFFVRDFKEVDDNVTRNVVIELNKNDWDIMILHYLGLDHIGHIYGPFSSLIPPKLKEMDEIIYKIYKDISNKQEHFFLAITGDHGMRDSGGHGGSTYSETTVPLVLLGYECKNDSFVQTDIPVNLAVLLGLNIPASAIGQIRSSILPFNLEKYLYVLRYNAILLKQKSSSCDHQYELASILHESYLKNSNEDDAFKAADFYINCSHLISEHLMKSSIKQDVIFMALSILLMTNIVLNLIYEIIRPGSLKREFLMVLIFFVIPLPNVFLVTLQILLLLVMLIVNLILVLKLTWHISYSSTTFLAFFTILHPLTFASSSFIEEEHQYWYFFNIVFVLGFLPYFGKMRKVKTMIHYLLMLMSLRFLRTLNSTGDQWANYPDFADWLLKQENIYYYQVFFLTGLLLVFYSQIQLGSKEFAPNVFNFVILCFIYVYKNCDSYISLGQLIWFLIFCHLLIFTENKIITWTLIIALLLKPYNIILVGYCAISSFVVSKELGENDVILYHLWLSNMLYFAQGHSNSLASVDISVGYIGLDEYRPFFVILQVLFHIYSFPILGHALTLRHPKVRINRFWNIIFCYRLYTFFTICIITFVQRHHLFIWSVFAPKLFIECVHIVFLFFEYCCYFALQKVHFVQYMKRTK